MSANSNDYLEGGLPEHFSQQAEEDIRDILENFDFDKTLKVMSFLAWSWQGRPPEKVQLQIQAEKLLRNVASTILQEPTILQTYATTGGLIARGHLDKGVLWLRLSFEVEAWNNDFREAELA